MGKKIFVVLYIKETMSWFC